MQVPDRLNLADYVLSAGRTTPDKIALEVLAAPGNIAEQWSFGELTTAIFGTANGLLKAGMKPGQFLLLRMGNISDFPILYLGAIAAGIIPVPSSAQLTLPELSRQLETLGGAGTIVTDDTLSPPPNWRRMPIAKARELRHEPPITPADTHNNDLAYIVFTSGTGAAPKAVAHAHRAIWARRMMWDDWYGLEPSDRMLHAGAFNWTYTLGTGLMDPWSIGATALIYAGPPDRHIWPSLAANHHPTLFAAAPGIYRQMLAAENLTTGFRSLRHGLSAGETLPQNVREQWSKATNKPIYEALGMSEISTFISSSPTNPHRNGTAGKPQTGRRIAILDEETLTPASKNGHLAIHRSDPGMMLGYHNAPDLTGAQFKGDWFLTGDSACQDEDGYITHLGRSDDVLNAGGYRVSPLEIEAVVCADPAIAECAAVELPVKADASVITVFYVAAKSEADPERLKEACTQSLASYKQPRAFRAIEALPRNPNGKLRRRALVETYGWKADP